MSQDVSWRDEWFRRRRFDSLYHLISDDGEVRPYREMRTLEREQKALLLAPHSPQEFRDSYPLPTLIELLNDPTFGKMASRLASVRQDNDYIVFRNSFGVSLAFLIKIALQELKPLPVSKKGKPLRLPFFTLRFATRRPDDLTLLWLMRALPYLYQSQKFAFGSQYINTNFLRREAWIECEEGVPSPAALATLAYTHKNVGALLSNVHLLPKESGYSELTIPDIAALKYTFDIKLEVIEEACRIGDSFDGVRSLIFNIANLSEKMYEDLAIEKQLGATMTRDGKPVKVRDHSQEFITFATRLRKEGVERIDLRYYNDMLARGIFDGNTIADHFLAGIDLDLVQW